MDHGKLTDSNGKEVDFRNVIIIMTTNAGAADLAKPAIGFKQSRREGDDMEAINRLFAPEFRNRLDAIIAFGHLPQEVVYRVVEKFVLQLETQLADRNVVIELTDEAREWLAIEGYDEHMGARPLARVIQEHIKKPLADQVLFGDLVKGGTVRVDIDRNEKGKTVGLKLEAVAEPVKPKRDPVPSKARKKAPAKRKTATKATAKTSAGGRRKSGGSGRGTVPKVPLKT